MKTITEKIKAKIFAQYYYCQVLGKYIDSDELDPIEIMNTRLVDYIELNPLSNITDEDAIEVYKLTHIDRFDKFNKSINVVNKINETIEFLIKSTKSADKSGYLVLTENHAYPIKAYQCLQSKGYALDYSVDDLVELGVYKLKL